MSGVVTFGEIMMRLATPGFSRLSQANTLEMSFGGGEANVAVALAGWGVPSVFVTRLPDNPLGRRVVQELRGLAVDTSQIARGGDRIGIYFLEHGASQRASTVTYDRANSAVAQMDPSDISWTNVMQGAEWFHWTGITPALSESAAASVSAACAAARDAGARVSVDLNYRKKLWSREKARAVMQELVQRADLCIANEEDAESVFGIRGAAVESGVLERDAYVQVARELSERLGIAEVAITLRQSISASRNGWSALLYSGGQAYFGAHYDVTVVDRVGAGDSFAAALIYCMLQHSTPQQAVEWATAASALKHTIEGDFNRVTLQEVDALVAGDASGRVQR